ncbi:PREDICTED: uncharacterized protein LOC104809407 isoform X3 [Tarenaya hassleriana]|uniref:uncharacterized protein LOC104809407 isoform X2 n=1 Tax=Tarenaya hassleriana TaxID=28532 RepID=UPI00053C9537|nr:PREDICTED: uncharacterized protein LOC104809407 isoform X2 [Tarenaya hassleriana]XP_010533694.1 PREDICTED: uncharacterized protein LOC104809407 isoform X3 [Tarenaya hassleriana]
MDPKSPSESKTMTEEAPNEQETKTGSMGIADSSVKKRKAEEDASDSEYASDPEDDGEDGEMEVENEAGESDNSSAEDLPEWGVDSFDGSEYESPNDDEEYFSDEETDLKLRRYLRQIYESRGFKVDFGSAPRCVGGYFPVVLDSEILPGQTARQYMEKMVAAALEKYNRIEGTSVECDHIVRAVTRSTIGTVSYITFMAKEKPGDKELVEYQAKTLYRVWLEMLYPIFCRKASEAKDVSKVSRGIAKTTDGVRRNKIRYCFLI